MNNRVNSLVRRCLNGAVQSAEWNVLSGGGRVYVARVDARMDIDLNSHEYMAYG